MWLDNDWKLVINGGKEEEKAPWELFNIIGDLGN